MKQSGTPSCFQSLAVLILPAVIALWLSGCSTPQSSPLKMGDVGMEVEPEPEQQFNQSEDASPMTVPDSAASERTYDIPRFAINSPFETKYESPVPEKGKKLWARSFLWEKAPDLVVEEWLTDEPETKGKYLLIEFWATWCRQCRLAVPVLNNLHEKFRDDMIVIGISDETEEVIGKLEKPKIEYYLASDTRARMKDKVGVFGIPHVIIVEPEGYVVWEGFPLLKGHELTGEVVEKILKAGKSGRAVKN